MYKTTLRKKLGKLFLIASVSVLLLPSIALIITSQPVAAATTPTPAPGTAMIRCRLNSYIPISTKIRGLSCAHL
jgi:hypothetical protein